MSTVYGANITKLDAATATSNPAYIDQGQLNANVLVQIDSYEASGLVATSTIDVAQLPIGAKVVGFTIAHDALGTGVTLSLGDSGSATRYLAATASATAGCKNDILVDGFQYAITTTALGRIFLTVGTASATGTIKTAIYYTK